MSVLQYYIYFMPEMILFETNLFAKVLK